MNTLLIIITIISLVTSFSLYSKTQKTKKHMLDLIKETKRVTNSADENSLLFQTNDKLLQNMCTELNEIIAENNKNKIEYDSVRNSLFNTLSNISHDIKTPLATALGYIEILEKDHDENKAVHKIKSKILEVNKIINQFSILSKLDSNDILLSLEPININEVCRQTLFAFEPLFRKENFETKVNIPEKSMNILADPYAVTSILENLINNALIHGNDGKFFYLAIHKQNNNVIITIMDKGKGIMQRNIPHIFERTFMEENSRNSKNRGSGLGLAIVREYLTLLNGRIEVNSTPHVETIFKITFPIL